VCQKQQKRCRKACAGKLQVRKGVYNIVKTVLRPLLPLLGKGMLQCRIFILPKQTTVMLQFTTTILQFEEMGEKTGWCYIEIPAATAQRLYPGNKKSFRVKGFIDQYAFEAASLLPMGGGDFILPVNATIRKAIKKQRGASVKVKMERDDNPEPVKMIPALQECLEDEPVALANFTKLPRSHRNYFIKWIESAKTEPTRTKRIALTVNAMARGMDFGAMMRSQRDDRQQLLG
jgi:hypothetical protein